MNSTAEVVPKALDDHHSWLVCKVEYENLGVVKNKAGANVLFQEYDPSLLLCCLLWKRRGRAAGQEVFVDLTGYKTVTQEIRTSHVLDI